mgnify:CR=1 FL=1
MIKKVKINQHTGGGYPRQFALKHAKKQNQSCIIKLIILGLFDKIMAVIAQDHSIFFQQSTGFLLYRKRHIKGISCSSLSVIKSMEILISTIKFAHNRDLL